MSWRNSLDHTLTAPRGMLRRIEHVTRNTAAAPLGMHDLLRSERGARSAYISETPLPELETWHKVEVMEVSFLNLETRFRTMHGGLANATQLQALYCCRNNDNVGLNHHGAARFRLAFSVEHNPSIDLARRRLSLESSVGKRSRWHGVI